MRILHTADWHLGRVFNGFSLLEDQAKLLDRIGEMVESEKPDLFILAGDVFDRTNPRREAVELFDRFLERVYAKSTAAIAVIAGNHDAPERIGFGGALHDRQRVLIRGGLPRSDAPLLLETEEGTVAVAALPYAGIFAARDYFGDPGITTPDQVVAAQVAAAKSRIPKDANTIYISHTFVAGGEGSESERSLESAGGIEQVSPHRYAGASYVALGHLHRPQEIAIPGGRLRYSGSILPFGFDELESRKSVSMVDLEWWGVAGIEELYLDPPRPLRVLHGSFGEILQAKDTGGERDFIKLELTDDLPIPDAMSRLRQRYPNAVQLEWVNRKMVAPGDQVGASREGLVDPAGVIRAFYRDAGAEKLTEAQEKLVDETLAKVREEQG